MNKDRKKRGKNNAEFSKESFSQNMEATVKNAIMNDKLVSLHYFSLEKGVTERIIEPMDVVIKHGKKNIVGWCRLREDWRTFRIDRVVQIAMQINERFEPRENYKRSDFEDENSSYNQSATKDLPYSDDIVKTMSENKLKFDDTPVKEYTDDEEELSL